MMERLEESISQHSQKVDWQRGDVISPSNMMTKGARNSRTPVSEGGPKVTA